MGEVEEPAGEGARSRVLALQAPVCPGLGNGGVGSRHGHCSHSQGKYRARGDVHIHRLSPAGSAVQADFLGSAEGRGGASGQ